MFPIFATWNNYNVLRIEMHRLVKAQYRLIIIAELVQSVILSPALKVVGPLVAFLTLAVQIRVAKSAGHNKYNRHVLEEWIAQEIHVHAVVDQRCSDLTYWGNVQIYLMISLIFSFFFGHRSK